MVIGSAKVPVLLCCLGFPSDVLVLVFDVRDVSWIGISSNYMCK